MPKDARLKIDKLKEVAMEIFQFLKPGYVCKIVFVSPVGARIIKL